jgi:DNA mismatch endonuclease, patch repair protein
MNRRQATPISETKSQPALAKTFRSCRIPHDRLIDLPNLSLISMRRKLSRRLPRRKRTKAEISYNMSRIKSTGSKIERHMEQALLAAALYPQKHGGVMGKPDFLFPDLRVAVFCDSHFWHGYQWKKRKRELRRNRKFWVQKISDNMKRDRTVNRALRKAGWKVFRFWEHQILNSAGSCVAKIKDAINSQEGKISLCR